MSEKELIKIIEASVQYLWPGINRGPAHEQWVGLMRSIAKALNWRECPLCHGNGWSCTHCYFIGYIRMGNE
jgi:hypothetical protein